MLNVARSTMPACAPSSAHRRSYSSTIVRRASETRNSCPSAARAPGPRRTRDGWPVRRPPWAPTRRRANRGGSFDEGHLVDFAQRADAVHHALDGRVAEEAHAFLARGLFDLGGGPARQNHVANVVREV